VGREPLETACSKDAVKAVCGEAFGSAGKTADDRLV